MKYLASLAAAVAALAAAPAPAQPAAPPVAPTRAMLEKYGIAHDYNESGGGHTWINWRRYLADFAPRLFR